MTTKNLLKKITEIVGKGYASDSIEERICYSYDATAKEYLPDIVVKPLRLEEIARVVELAGNEGLPIVPRGAGTGFVGGSLAVNGGISLVMTRMKKIISIDEENSIAVVEPGVITYQFQKEVEKKGLFYPPDPASLKISTLGGNAAMCAGGPRAVKYGVTKDYVLGMELVLSDGKIITTGGKTLKGVVGYDLTKLLIGSEGTLGVISKIIMRLIPLPSAVRTLAVLFPSIEDAAAAVVEIASSKIIPSCLEFMDEKALGCVEEYLRSELFSDCKAVLFIEVDGDEMVVDSQKDTIEKICKKNRAMEVRIAKNNEERENLWLLRRSISPALGRLNKIKINEDITVPRSMIPAIIKKLHTIGETHHLDIINFGHAGDGNIHVNIMVDKNNTKDMARAEDAVKEVFDASLELGGTISGEHGVGITKMLYIKQELGEIQVDIMKKIKRVFDPKNIMNPGKIF